MKREREPESLERLFVVAELFSIHRPHSHEDGSPVHSLVVRVFPARYLVQEEELSRHERTGSKGCVEDLNELILGLVVPATDPGVDVHGVHVLEIQSQLLRRVDVAHHRFHFLDLDL